MRQRTKAYPQEIRDAAVKLYLETNHSCVAVIEKYGIKTPTLYKWIKKYQENANIERLEQKGVSQMSKKLRLPKGWTTIQAHEAVLARKWLDEVKFGQFCREKGILTKQVDEWEKWFNANPNLVSQSTYSDAQQALVQSEKKHKTTQQDLVRKEKALAETAALLVLAKKAQAIWGDKEN